MIDEDMKEALLMEKLQTVYECVCIRHIGRGSFGTVFECMKNGERLAIKVVQSRKQLNNDECNYMVRVTKNRLISKQFIVELVGDVFTIDNAYNCIPMKFYPKTLR